MEEKWAPSLSSSPACHLNCCTIIAIKTSSSSLGRGGGQTGGTYKNPNWELLSFCLIFRKFPPPRTRDSSRDLSFAIKTKLLFPHARWLNTILGIISTVAPVQVQNEYFLWPWRGGEERCSLSGEENHRLQGQLFCSSSSSSSSTFSSSCLGSDDVCQRTNKRNMEIIAWR